ncbi:MAG TPA: ATP-binding protein [Clostridiales bacterium]|nr:ATP-binding protein [Clostridiales bacterium]HQP69326.1 ATP-binding protein [Clostridiales bacterium]
MIHSLTIKNFLSFRDEVTYSFEASKDRTFEDHHVVEAAKGVRLLKLGILYGSNASGKSNLIAAFQFLINFWFIGTDNKYSGTNAIPFLLDKTSRNHPSVFKLVFYKDGIKYVYYLEVDQKAVLYEKLDMYPGTQPATLFERNYDEKSDVSKIVFKGKNNISKITQDELNVKCLKNMSVLAALRKINAYLNGLSDVTKWLFDHVFNSIVPNDPLQHFSEELIKTNPSHKLKMLECLKEADFNISDINVKEFVQSVDDDFIKQAQTIGNFLSIRASVIEDLKKDKSFKYPVTEFKHTVVSDGRKEIYGLPIEWQSEGTKRIFGLFGAIIKSIEDNAFITIDEIESKLHPRLIEYVLEHFLRNSDQAQVLVATHYDNLFDETDLLRKDNFWFTEKREDGSTKLYPLTGFNGLNRISSLQKAYKYGKFGAVPNID